MDVRQQQLRFILILLARFKRFKLREGSQSLVRHGGCGNSREFSGNAANLLLLGLPTECLQHILADPVLLEKHEPLRRQSVKLFPRHGITGDLRACVVEERLHERDFLVQNIALCAYLLKFIVGHRLAHVGIVFGRFPGRASALAGILAGRRH